jgi:hypothetical protein
VPTVSGFFGITITIDDHGRPHFHARHADGSAGIRIDEIEVIDSSLAGSSGGWFSHGRSFIARSCSITGVEHGVMRH